MTYLDPVPLERRHVAARFNSGEPSLDSWLKEHALANQAGGGARVFVTADTVAPNVIVGYYALAAAQVSPADARGRLRAGQPQHRPIPVILLGRLAVHIDHQGRGLGASLLKDVMLRVNQAADIIGVRALLVHAKNEAARAWYLKYGFEVSPTDDLHLVLLLKDLRGHLSRAS